MVMTLQVRFLNSSWHPVALFLVATLFWSFTLYPAGEVAAQQARTVTVTPAKRSNVIDQIAVVGTLLAKEEIRVNALVEGKEVKAIFADVGTFVLQGQPLAELDATEAKLLLEKNAAQFLRASAAVAQEHSRIEIAEVSERETRKVVERSRSLIEKGAVSRQLLDEHENAFSRARSQLELARQSLRLAEADRKIVEREHAEISLTIERSIVRATEPGLIINRQARIGAMTSSSAGPMFTIARDGVIEMEASVGEMSIAHLKEGMKAVVTVPGTDQPIQGRLRLNAAQIDQATRMATVRLELNQNETLVSGAFAHGRIETDTRSNVVVPATAVRNNDGKTSVFVVSNQRASLRPVITGTHQGNLVEILNGIEDSELVVIKAGSFLKPDEKIDAVLVSGSGPDEISAANLGGSVAQ